MFGAARCTQGGSDGSVRQSCKCNYVDITKMPGPHADTARVMPGAHAHIAHTVCVKPGSHADTVCVKPGPHADINLKSKLWLACSRELMSCVGRLCTDYLYLLNSTTQRQLSATNPHSTTHNGSQLGAAECRPLPSDPPWVTIMKLVFLFKTPVNIIFVPPPLSSCCSILQNRAGFVRACLNDVL